MPTIALFTYSTRPRGSVVHAAALAEALMDAGASVTLYALSKPGTDFYRPLRCPLVLIPAAEAPADADLLIRQRIEELQRGFASLGGGHDLYHAEDCLTASALLTSGAAGLRPVVRTVHHVERFQSPFLAECQRRSIVLSELVLSVSAFTAREVKQEFGREAEVVHNGVDHARFAGAPPDADLEGRFDIDSEDLVVLSVGGVEERKNSLRALEAVSRAYRSQPRLRWLVVGGDSIWDHSGVRGRFAERLAELPSELKQRIRCTGPVDEATLTALYRRSDVLLSPSLHEGWGLAALEGMAARTAVVCPDREPFTEFVDHETARLVDPESVDAIAAALSSLLADAPLRARLGRAGELRAERYSWRRSARRHLTAYRALLQKSAGAKSLGAIPAPPGA